MLPNHVMVILPPLLLFFALDYYLLPFRSLSGIVTPTQALKSLHPGERNVIDIDDECVE